jgi:hypothetical protein
MVYAIDEIPTYNPKVLTNFRSLNSRHNTLTISVSFIILQWNCNLLTMRNDVLIICPVKRKTEKMDINHGCGLFFHDMFHIIHINIKNHNNIITNNPRCKNV